MAYLYRITSPSNKQYIGIAKDVNKRWSVHVAEASSGSKTAFHKAIRKYGKSAFTREILVIGEYEYIKNLEVAAISKFDTRSPNGYNLTDGGDGTVGYSHSDQAKKLMSEVTKLRMADPSAREYLRSINIGKKQSDETKNKKSIASRKMHQQKPHPMKGKTLSDETKRKISESLIGNSRTKGHKLTDEHKRKVSEAMKGRDFSDETRSKLRAAQLGRRYSAEVRAKMAAAARLREQLKKEIRNAKV
jgi:group I intron endonuclease